MNEISFAAPEIAVSGQRGTPAGESKLWETLPGCRAGGGGRGDAPRLSRSGGAAS
jgi:hypothetical protein